MISCFSCQGMDYKIIGFSPNKTYLWVCESKQNGLQLEIIKLKYEKPVLGLEIVSTMILQSV